MLRAPKLGKNILGQTDEIRHEFNGLTPQVIVVMPGATQLSEAASVGLPRRLNQPEVEELIDTRG
jgi:hypothetical protein